VRIYAMTATFGKLEHQTLTLQPGLNILKAPNEWGKSTWCAFLVAMLYGIDTGARTTKTALADKERYAPWSGSPLAGRMDLNWNGKDITIERRTKGRLIFGDFRAYETASGIEIPELNAANCGQMLLGVERSVFLRSGFLRLSDLPVTQDDALRRRLNNLVTTGDESGTGDRLAQRLKDLKNKCRYNRSGLLPQAEAERETLQRKLSQLQELNSQQERTAARQAQLSDMIAQLENHKQTLAYVAAQEDAAAVEQAQQAKIHAQTALERQKQHCETIPSYEQADQALQTGQDLLRQRLNLQKEIQTIPPDPQPPQIPELYQNQTPSEAVAAAEKDFSALQTLNAKSRRQNRLLTVFAVTSCIVGIGCVAAAFLLQYFNPWVFIGLIAATVLATIFTGFLAKRARAKLDALCRCHPGLEPDRWVPHATEYAVTQQAYHQTVSANQAQRNVLAERQTELENQIRIFAKDLSLEAALEYWQSIQADWEKLADVQLDFDRAAKYADTLHTVIKPVPKPPKEDTLNASLEDTLALLDRATGEQQLNQLRLGQLQGQAEALGQEAELHSQLKEISQRIDRLEDTYQALELALRALSAARSELQRRFAPRISARAQELFSKLTGGRYSRLTLGEDLSLHASAQDEDTLRSTQWRSEGTVDQLYLALRLAVAEELTPDAPLILDDALVRFDDQRLAVALDILKEEAANKQVILFTCQSREEKLV